MSGTVMHVLFAWLLLLGIFVLGFIQMYPVCWFMATAWVHAFVYLLHYKALHYFPFVAITKSCSNTCVKGYVKRTSTLLPIISRDGMLIPVVHISLTCRNAARFLVGRNIRHYDHLTVIKMKLTYTFYGSYTTDRFIIKYIIFILFLKIVIVCAFGLSMPKETWGGQRTNCGSKFFPSKLWNLEIEFRSSGLSPWTATHWAINVSCIIYYFHRIISTGIYNLSLLVYRNNDLMSI